MRIGEIIAAYCKDHGLSYRQFALQCGVTNGYISMIVNGANPKTGRPLNPTIETYGKLAAGMGMTTNELFEVMDDAPVSLAAPSARPLPPNLKPLGQLHRQRVPLIGKVAAGQPIMAEQDFETYVDAPVNCDAALEVQGDSMKPTYLDGDVIYIKCRPDVPEGQVAVVLIDDEATLKHVYKRSDGLTLWSDNPEYPPMVIDAADHDYIAIYGVPVGYTRIYRKDPLKNLKKGI